MKNTSSKKKETAEQDDDEEEDEDDNEEDDYDSDDTDVIIPALQELANSMSAEERKKIQKQCKGLLAKVSTYKGDDPSSVLPLDEVVKIVNEWRPKQEIMSLYIRIARKLPSHFHLDSISTLLCVAKQCDYTPVNLLIHTKSLHIAPCDGRLGFKFLFKTKEADDTDALDRKFVGLSLTLALLQHSVTQSCGVISRDGMRSSKPRQPVNKNVDLGDNTNISFKTMPSHEFHKQSSLINRLWLAINHRWMAYYLVFHLFDIKGILCTKNSILVYTFMMHSSAGRSRFNFLDPLVGYCFRFQTRDDIEANQTRLVALWKDPSTFVTTGNRYLERDDKVRIIIDTFQLLKDNFVRTTAYGQGIDKDRRWLMLRAYIFSFWLRRTNNREIRCEVEFGLANLIYNKKVSELQERQQEEQESLPPTLNVLPPTPILHNRSRRKRTTAPITTIALHDGNKGQHNDNEQTTLLHNKRKKTKENQDMWCRRSHTSINSGSEATTSNLTNTNEDSTPQDYDLGNWKTTLLSKDWTKLQVMTQTQLDQVMSSFLLIHAEYLDISLKLSPLDVYSADKLKKFRHCRVSGPPGYQPEDRLCDSVLQLSSSGNNDEFLDKYSRFIHIARERSGYFKEYTKLLPDNNMFINLCRSILKYGEYCERRSEYQYRVNIGCGGQHHPGGVPATLIGKDFAWYLDIDNEFDTQEILSSIGMIVEFTWCIAQDMQRDVADAPLAPDCLRWNEYARHLCDYLFIEDTKVGFEDVTLVISPITSRRCDVVLEHTDVMNDDVGGYSRTCVFNTCFSLDGDTHVHMQVICNFRKVIRQHLVPFSKSLESIIKNANKYIESWRLNMKTIYGAVSSKRDWDPFNRKNIFLDDELPFKRIPISNSSANKIHGEYLLTEIGLSRVTSLSMFIDIINRSGSCKRLCTDQQVELAFFASMHSNPFWFHHVLDKLISKEDFCFEVHPIYNVIQELYETFGTWQGGPHNRWSPCGGSVPVPNVFGAHPTATSQEKGLGVEKLTAIIAVLFSHLKWVNALIGKGSDPLNDLPFPVIQEQWKSITDQIFEIIPCQFKMFRLSVFTTIAIGCNLLDPGVHLKQLMIPLEKTAAYNHLVAPSKGQMSEQSASDLANHQTTEIIVQASEDDRVVSDNHDRLMLYLSNSLGRKLYVRDEIECLLCESHPGRSLDCRDWYCKGQNIFDLRDDGVVTYRLYGKDSGDWKPIGPVNEWTFRFLKHPHGSTTVDPVAYGNIHYQVLDESIANYCHLFGLELRQSPGTIKFNGRGGSERYDNPYIRQSTTTNRNCLKPHHYRSAIFYSETHGTPLSKQSRSKKMVVLGHGETPKSLIDKEDKVNKFESFDHGSVFLNKIRDLMNGIGAIASTANNICTQPYASMIAGCYHQECVDNTSPSAISYFSGHIDKNCIDNVWFVPLGIKASFAFVAVPLVSKIKQDKSSILKFNTWLGTLSTADQESINQFKSDFERDACKFMNLDSVFTLIFSMCLGIILQFPANVLFHATIIPGNDGSTMRDTNSEESSCNRDLFICHPFVLV